ncbi:MAG TPA: NAD(P)-binding oxidoreductase [Blastococcus sp.]|nr:NAD(P)-binding oxidoreductase [Blastococcus sp.]
MKLVVLGATGGTGRLLVDQALGRGHEVVAYVRRPAALERREGLVVVAGELTDAPSLTAALAGADGVLCAIGPKGVKDLFGSDLMRRTLPVVAAAMTAAGVRRLVLMSAYGVGDTAASASPMARIAFATAVRSLYRDKQLAEARLADSDLDVTTVYPTALTNDPSAAADVRDVTTLSRVSGMPKISRAAVATAMLDAVEDPATVGRRLLVTRPGTAA